MNTTPRLRILPLLIMVAMLAFSVRLADFAMGVSSLSGAAMAEEKPKEDAPTPEEAMAKPGMADAPAMPDPTKLAAASKESDEQAEAEAEDKQESNEEDSESWRDSSEDELEYSTVTTEMIQEMADRRKEMEAREKQLMAREALLRAAEQEIDRKYQELSNLRGEIEALLQQQSEEEKARVQSLVKIYEGMKPKEAARIFDTLDLDVLVTVMSQMSERRLSPILANMNPERARTITIMLAEEKQLPTLPQSN